MSYLFPPAGGIAVQRALSFAKYLPKLGLEVHVLKAWNAAAPVRDPGLLDHIPPEVKVHSAFAPEIPFAFRQKVWALLSRRGGKTTASSVVLESASARQPLPARLIRRILCPEPEILWVPFALRKAKQIVRRYKIDTVLITAPPFSILEVGARLKQALPGVKVVSDFRDEWLTFYLKDFEFQSGNRTRQRAEEIERAAVAASDLVIAVTPVSLDKIRKRYPEQDERKFACVPNGYDPEVFAGFTSRRSGSGRVMVSHMGTVYKTASPRYYLDALDNLPGEIREQFETRFIGRVSEGEKAALENRKSHVDVLGFVPQREALKMLEETDYVLLTLADDQSLPGKLFEYLATGKPILALSTPGGEVERILRETGAGWCADPRDPEAVCTMLRKALECARGQRPGIEPDWNAIRRYERPRLAEELAQCLDRA